MTGKDFYRSQEVITLRNVSRFARVDLPKSKTFRLRLPPGGGGVLPYMGYIGMCGPKGYGFVSRFGHKLGIDFSHFAAILVINRVSIFAL